MRQVRRVFGTVLRLRCATCGAVFPYFQFSGEEDASTAGLCSASSCEVNEVVVGELNKDEWNTFDSGGASSFQERVSLLLDRHDLRIVRLLRVDAQEGSGSGVGFREFLNTYKPPLLVFSCACCHYGESKPIEEISVDDFKKSGGCVTVLGHLAL